MPIQVLDPETIDKIAAGEVVEKPSSVVKELVENAIDAGSKAITVEIKDGGISYLRVTDNGCGIPAGELRTAFLRHATSKISSAEDLSTVTSLGFRGEALSSIAAVSKLEIITRTKDSLTGVRMTMEGARETGFDEIGAPIGTTIIIRSLFYNTPPRKKFLKSPVSEAAAVTDLMEHLAISRPDVSFQFMQNGQARFHTSGNGDLKEVIYRIYGKEVSSGIIPIEVQEGGISIHGFLGKPELVRSNRNFEIYFINGRFVKSSVIAKAIEEGYREYLMQHKFPLCILLFDVDTTRVDVNVHPTKMDIRISEPELFFKTVSKLIFSTLKNREMIPGHVLDKEKDLKAEAKKDLQEIRSMRNPEPFENARIQQMTDKPRYVNSSSGFMVRETPPSYEPAPGHVQAKEVQKVDKSETYTEDKTEIRIGVQSEARQDYSKEDADEFFVDFTAAPSTSSRTLQTPETPRIPQTSLASRTIRVSQASQTAQTSSALQTSQASGGTQTPMADDPMPVISNVKQMDLFEERIISRDNRAKYKIIGQIFDTYWIVQFEQKMFIIDQHAAHEKVNYERLMKRVREKNVLSQSLLPPVIVALSGKEEQVLLEHMDAFLHLGYEIDHFGGNEYALRGVPVDLFGHSERELFLEVLDELAEGNSRGSYKAIEEKVASMSCKASIKGGDRISTQEAKQLIDELLTLENPYNCPHGRPTIVAMTKTELEKKFKRIVD